MKYDQPSAILLVRKGANGYSVQGISWLKSPPDPWPRITAALAVNEATDETGVANRAFEDLYFADDKPELLTLIQSFLNTQFPPTP